MAKKIVHLDTVRISPIQYAMIACEAVIADLSADSPC